MGWTSIFKAEEKPMSVYESDLFEKYLDQRGLRETSKDTYRGYRDNFVGWLKANNIGVPGVDDCKKFLTEKRNITNGRQAKARYDLFRAYVAWLVTTGKMDVNVWEQVNLEELQLTNHQLNESRRKRPIVPKASFTLSEVAELLLAIEDNDDKAIAKILEGKNNGK